VKTLKWSPPLGVTVPEGTTVTPGCAWKPIRSVSQAAASRMIVDAQVAVEEDQSGFHVATLRVG
jgi:hypothetical protein